MGEPVTSLEKIADEVIDLGVGHFWDRLSPLSAGAVASGVVIVSACTLLRRALGFNRRGGLGWLTAAALVPLGLWLLAGTGDGETAEESRGAEGSEGGGTVRSLEVQED